MNSPFLVPTTVFIMHDIGAKVYSTHFHFLVRRWGIIKFLRGSSHPIGGDAPFFWGGARVPARRATATETMGHVVLPRVFRTAADTADIYGGVPDALFAPLFDVADKADIYGGMPDCLLWQAYDAFVASLRTVRGRAHPAASPRPRRRPAATLRPRVQRARRAARSRRPARACPEAEAARPQRKPTRAPGARTFRRCGRGRRPPRRSRRRAPARPFRGRRGARPWERRGRLARDGGGEAAGAARARGGLRRGRRRGGRRRAGGGAGARAREPRARGTMNNARVS